MLNPQRVYRPKARREARVSIVRLCAAALLLLAVTSPQARQAPDARRIDIVARRFAFEPARIEVRVGEPIVLAVRSADGVHGIDIRGLDLTRRIPRGGSVVTIPFTATKPGEFPILCSEYCGADHETMKGLLVVQAGER